MRTIVICAVVAVGLATAGAARAGCMATAGISPKPPDAAGVTWSASIRILQHGRTPLAGAKPTLTIRNVDSGTSKTVAARTTGEVGTYRADVVFPSAGTWRYEVNDGFPVRECAQTHTFAPVEIAGAGGGGGTSLAWTLSGSAALALAFGALLLAGLRPRRRGMLVAASTR